MNAGPGSFFPTLTQPYLGDGKVSNEVLVKFLVEALVLLAVTQPDEHPSNPLDGVPDPIPLVPVGLVDQSCGRPELDFDAQGIGDDIPILSFIFF